MRAKKSAARARKEAPTQAALRKRKALEPKTLSFKTINNALTVLRKLLSVAEEQRVIQQAPRVKLFTKLPKPAFDFLTFEEAERVINAAEPEWRTLILVGLKTGLRQGELIGLQWADLDLSARQAPRPPDHLARGVGASQGRAGADGGPPGFGRGCAQGSPAPARPLRLLPGGRAAAHRWADERTSAASPQAGGHLPRAGAHRVARPAAHLRQPPRDAGRPAQGHPGADGTRDHRDDRAVRPSQSRTPGERRSKCWTVLLLRRATYVQHGRRQLPTTRNNSVKQWRRRESNPPPASHATASCPAAPHRPRCPRASNPR